MKYKHIVNKPTLNNVLDSRNGRKQQCPVFERTDTFIDKGQMVTNQNTDYLKLSSQVRNGCNSRNVNKRYILRASPTVEKPNMYKD